MSSFGQQSKSFLPQLKSLFNGEGKDILSVILYATIIGVCSLIVPIAVQALVNSVAAASILQPIVVLSGFVAGTLVFSGFMTILQLIIVELIQRRLMVRCSIALAHNLPLVEVNKFLKYGGANNIPRYLELFSIQKLVTTILLDGTAVFFQIVIGLILVSFYHPYFLGISLLILIYIIFLVFILGIGGIKTSKAQSDAKYSVLSWLLDLTKIPALFKTNEAGEFAIRKMDILVTRYLHERSRHFSILIRQHTAALLLQVVGGALLLGLGGWLVIKGQLTLGQLVAAELVFSLILSAVVKLCRHLEKFYDLVASVGKLDSLFDLPYESQQGTMASPSGQPFELKIHGLTLYSEADAPPIIENLTFTLTEGEKVVIWGPNASGKSYLANAIYRISEGFSGRIELDGISIKSLHPESLRQVVVLIRGFEIFKGSILDNIRIHNLQFPENEAIQLLKMFGLTNKINLLKDGIYSTISSHNHPFSYGEALRLMIVRGIISNPKILIIDGTLDSMDTASQELVLQALTHKIPSISVLLLTHETSLKHSLQHSYEINNKAIIPSQKVTTHEP